MHASKPFNEYVYERLKKHYTELPISVHRQRWTPARSAGHIEVECKEAIRTHISLPTTFFEFSFPALWDWESCYLEQLQLPILGLAAAHILKNMGQQLANLADYKATVIFRKYYLLIVAGFSEMALTCAS